MNNDERLGANDEQVGAAHDQLMRRREGLAKLPAAVGAGSGSILDGLRGRYEAAVCASCGAGFEAWRGALAPGGATPRECCSTRCESDLWHAERRAEKLAQLTELLGEEMATPFDWARCKGRREEIARALAWRPTRQRPNLVLNGPTDRGKTRAAVAVLQASYLRTGVLPVVVWPGDFTTAVAEAWGEVDASSLKRRWVDASLLLLDDIDKEKFTERAAEMLFAVLDARLRHGRPTILTLNMDGGEFAAKFPTPRTAAAAIRRITDYGDVLFP
ncbi:MAG: hypothetical protein RL077_344 [Verrucomicrobiota bacterium]|jgi:DNA replication protein DnaC